MATINFNNTLYQPGFVGTDDGAARNTFQVDDASTVPISVNGTVSAKGDPVTITFNPGTSSANTITVYATNFDNGQMIEFVDSADGVGDANTTRYLLSNTQVYGTGSPMRTRFTADGNGTVGDYVVCFLAGTRILAVRDGLQAEVEVETLAIGDLVVTASGAHRPVRWLGKRSYVGRFANRNRDVLPICFKAGSLAECLPKRDLWVSPKHAMFIDGMLVPAEHLVNGVSVIKATRVDRVDYHHVELDSHDVLLAEGAPSESFVDDNGRQIFHNADEHEALYPDAVRADAVYCAPRLESGFELEAIRNRIDARAGIVRKAA